MIYKRATKKVQESGLPGTADIQIVKRLYGAAPENIMYEKQHSTCFRTPNDAVKAVLDGYRPEQMTNHLTHA